MSSCACGCGRRVKEAGHYRKVCRLRERAAGRPCPRNMISADQRVISEKKRCLNSCHLISRIKEFEEENSESCYLRNQTRSVRAKAPHNHRPRRWFWGALAPALFWFPRLQEFSFSPTPPRATRVTSALCGGSGGQFFPYSQKYKMNRPLLKEQVGTLGYSGPICLLCFRYTFTSWLPRGNNSSALRINKTRTVQAWRKKNMSAHVLYICSAICLWCTNTNVYADTKNLGKMRFRWKTVIFPDIYAQAVTLVLSRLRSDFWIEVGRFDSQKIAELNQDLWRKSRRSNSIKTFGFNWDVEWKKDGDFRIERTWSNKKINNKESKDVWIISG